MWCIATIYYFCGRPHLLDKQSLTQSNVQVIHTLTNSPTVAERSLVYCAYRKRDPDSEYECCAEARRSVLLHCATIVPPRVLFGNFVIGGEWNWEAFSFWFSGKSPYRNNVAKGNTIRHQTSQLRFTYRTEFGWLCGLEGGHQGEFTSKNTRLKNGDACKDHYTSSAIFFPSHVGLGTATLPAIGGSEHCVPGNWSWRLWKWF